MYRCAIIGCGRIAGGYDRTVPTEWSATHAGAYHLCPETELVAVCDTDTRVLSIFQEKWDVDKSYLDYKKMLNEVSADIVSLCLPTEYHFDAFKECMKQNVRAVFCEKPLSYKLDDAKKMVEMSRDKIVSVNYFRRWNTSIESIVEDYKKGIWGKAKAAVIRYTKGVLVNGSHLVDMMRWFWGEPVQIKYIKTSGEDEVDPGVDFLLAFSNGATAYFIHVPSLDYVFVDVDMVMERGRIVFSQRGQQQITYGVENEIHYGLFKILGPPQQKETHWRHCMVGAVNEIVHCIEKGGRPSCTMEDGLRAMEICREVLKQASDTEYQYR